VSRTGVSKSKTYIAYNRVSTKMQGESGLGLEAQNAATKTFVASCGASAKLLASYTEVESGKRADRPELVKALEHARLTDGVLLIAKLDRLSRDAHFLLGLQKAGVRFTAVDMPHADNFTVGIMALVAQKERESISERTKAALAAAKARGVKLGNPKGAAHIAGRWQKEAVAALKAGADERAKGLASTIAGIRAGGVTSANAIAAELNRREIATARGGKWSARSVLNVLARL
jgi:DNA invertase Pin-like site-specific DNA recombinase